jgi:hypothetical protein
MEEKKETQENPSVIPGIIGAIIALLVLYIVYKIVSLYRNGFFTNNITVS